MGVKLSHQQNAALLYPNLSARVNQHNSAPNDPLEAVKKPTKIVLLGTGEGKETSLLKRKSNFSNMEIHCVMFYYNNLDGGDDCHS